MYKYNKLIFIDSIAMRQLSLDDKYESDSGRVFINGNQALVRLPMLQKHIDEARGLNTAGYISGYRGSPLGGYDTELDTNLARLNERSIQVHTAVCEGCGDCSDRSDCLSIEPVETALGTRRAIDQASCNADYSCVNC